MAFLDFLRPRADGASAPAVRDPSDNFWFDETGRKSAAGVNVTVERARQVPVVRDSLLVLSQTTSTLSFMCFEKMDDDSREKAAEHPVMQLMSNPNPRDTSFEFFAAMVDDLAARGGYFAEVKWSDSTGYPEQLWRIDPDFATLEERSDRTRRVVVREPGRPTRILLEEEFWYIPLPPMKTRLRGRSPILDDGKETIGAAIALQDFANTFFANDATPPFVFKHKSHFDDSDSKKNFVNAWTRWLTGKNRHRPGVLEYGIEIEKLGVDNEEAQFIETRKEVWLDCIRLWRMQPHKVGILDKATYSNIEHQSLEFVVDVLGPWIELIERSIWKWLIQDPRYYFEFNVGSLLRGDIKTRFEAYALGRQWGWLSVNEIRRLENQNGIGRDGDRFMVPMNMTEPGAIAPEQNNKNEAIAFLRQSAAKNNGRPKLKVIQNAA